MKRTPSHRALVWTGRVIAALVGALFLFSGMMKFVGGEQLEEGMKHLGLPMPMVIPLAILEITCTIIYLIPQTAVIGAILLTGYIGGAICTHWRVGDLFVLHIVIGILIWFGVWCRESRLRTVIPLRTRDRA